MPEKRPRPESDWSVVEVVVAGSVRRALLNLQSMPGPVPEHAHQHMEHTLFLPALTGMPSQSGQPAREETITSIIYMDTYHLG